MTSSAAPGMPVSPSRVEVGPSCMTPLPTRPRSSSCTVSGSPKARAYSSARRMRAEDITGRPSSESATQPAAWSSPYSASSSPSEPLEMAPTG
jgi:hypothetical protein